jgi:restriction system protein
MAETSMWMIRSDRGALYEFFKERSVVALGWPEVGALSQYDSREMLALKVREIWPESSDGGVRNSAGQLYRFVHEIQPGDQIVTYDPMSRRYMVGSVSGVYGFDASQSFPNIRPVKWKGEVERDRLSVAARNSLGSVLTLFLIPFQVQQELNAALDGLAVSSIATTPTEEAIDEKELLGDIQTKATEFIKDRITQLNWDEAQELVAGLLRAMGYKTQVSPPGADRGKDIVASPDGFGFEAPRIVVEVKHRNQAIGSQAIRSFLGGRHAQDRGLYVSTGSFSKDALYEADRANIPLQLMDLDLLVSSLLTYYEKLDVETQRLLPLRRFYWPA